jgi:uncharacterized damage-inducible protein DinB
MTESQRQPVPRNDGGELDTAMAFLDFARNCVLKKADGLSEQQLRQVLVDSGTNILGLVQHLTVAEQLWFSHDLLGEEPDREWDFGMDVPAGRGAEQVLADYRAAIEASNTAIRAVGDPAALMVRPVDDKRLSLRWLLAHATSETARHAGHADILREQIDGVTGR